MPVGAGGRSAAENTKEIEDRFAHVPRWSNFVKLSVAGIVDGHPSQIEVFCHRCSSYAAGPRCAGIISLLQYSKHVGNPWSLCEFPGFRTAGPEGESHKLCRRPGSWLRKSTHFGGVSGHRGESRTDCGNVQPALTKGRHPSRVVHSILPNLRSQLQSRARYELQRQCINCRSGKGGYFVKKSQVITRKPYLLTAFWKARLSH